MFIKFIKGIFTPVVNIMSHLWYWQKFVVITILFTIPVGYALFSYIIQINKNIAFAEKEIVGVQYLSPALALLQDLQQHRGMASLYLRGDTSFLPRLLEKEKEIEEDFALITAEDKKFGQELGTVDTLKILQERWAVLEKNYTQLSPKESARQHTEFISGILALINLVGDTSNLILDPNLDSYYLMNTIVNTLPNLSETLGQARAFILSVQDLKKISDLERKDFINYSNIALTADEKIKRDMNVAFASNSSLKEVLEHSRQETSASMRSFSSLLDTFVDTNTIVMPLPEYYAFSTSVINTNFSLGQSLSASLEMLLQQRIEGFQNNKRTSIGITAVSYVLILYFFVSFYLLIARTVRDLETIAKQLVSGRVVKVPILSSDELGKVGESFNAIGQELIASNNEILGRAQELQKKSEELEHLNKFMINREVKMSELKDEIAKLKSASPPDLKQGERLDEHGRMTS